MTTHSLMEYMQSFPSDSIPSVIIFDRERRLKYPIRDVIGIADADCPVIILDVGEPVDFDGEAETP